MRPGQVSQTEIDVGLFEHRDVGQIRTLPAPIVELLGAVVGRNERKEVNQRGQTAGVAEWQRSQQERVHNAKDARVGTYADGKGKNRERGVPRTIRPKPKGVS